MPLIATARSAVFEWRGTYEAVLKYLPDHRQILWLSVVDRRTCKALEGECEDIRNCYLRWVALQTDELNQAEYERYLEWEASLAAQAVERDYRRRERAGSSPRSSSSSS